MSLAHDYIYNLDIDRIHKVLETQSGWRREGKTFATLALMLGEAHLGDEGNLYLYVGQNWKWVTEVQRDFAEILHHEGHDIKYTDRIVVCNGKVFRFTAVHHNMEQVIRGHLYDKVFIDLTYDLEQEYHTELHYLKCREISI